MKDIYTKHHCLSLGSTIHFWLLQTVLPLSSLCHKPHMNKLFLSGLFSLQVGILALARRQLLPWQWEAPVSSLLAEMWTRLGRLWGRSSSRVTVLTSFTWSWIWPTCALCGNSVRASFRERRGLTSWSIMQVRGGSAHGGVLTHETRSSREGRA